MNAISFMNGFEFTNRIKYLRIILMSLILLITLLSFSINIQAFYSGLISYQSVGTDIAEYSVGTDVATVLVGDGVPVIPDATSPLDAYFGAKPVLLFLPAILLLGFVIWFFFLGFKEIKQSQLVNGLTYMTISFVLIGFILLISMPLILSGAESIIWFK
jgi:hypothetical protein